MLVYQRVTIEFWACLFTNQEITKGPKPYRSLAPLHPTTKACKSSQKPSRFHARSCKNGVSLFLKQPHVSLGFSKNVQVPHPYHLSGNDYVCVCVCICLYIYIYTYHCMSPLPLRPMISQPRAVRRAPEWALLAWRCCARWGLPMRI